MHYLYRITNQVNQKVYIGQAEDYEHRWSDHRRAVRLNKPAQAIHHAMIKHGIDNFFFEVIATCRSIEDANETETELVKQYDSYISNGKGYNATLGGMNAPKTEQWKAQMSAIKGGWIDRKHTEENLEKNRQAHLGTIASEESKRKMSKTMKQKCADGWVQANRAELSALGVAARAGKPSPKKKSLTDEEYKQIIELIDDGQSFTSISKMIHINRNILSRELKQRGIKTTTVILRKGEVRTLTFNQINEIKKLLNDGLSLRKIAKQIGVNRHLISRELKRMGYK